jgi:hypothetical protein
MFSVISSGLVELILCNFEITFSTMNHNLGWQSASQKILLRHLQHSFQELKGFN